MATQAFYISDLSAVTTPKTELPGGLLEVETKTGPSSSLQNKKVTLEQLGAFLAALGANANELPSLYKSVEFRTRLEQQQLYPGLPDATVMQELKGDTMALGTQVWANTDPDGAYVYRVVYDTNGPLRVWTDGTFGASGRGLQPAKFVAVLAPIAVTPAPMVAFDPATRLFTATSDTYGLGEIEYQLDAGAIYSAYSIQVDAQAYAAGRLKYRIRAAGTRLASAWAANDDIPALIHYSYADTGSDGISTNATLVSNLGYATRNNNILRGTGAGIYVEFRVETTQFFVAGVQWPQGSDFTVTVTDDTGKVMETGGSSFYAPLEGNSSILWSGITMPRANYTIRVQNVGNQGGEMLLDYLKYEGLATNFPYQEGISANGGADGGIVLTNMAGTGGFEYLGASNGTLWYGNQPNSSATFTPVVPVTRLQIKSIRYSTGSDFTVTIKDSTGAVVKTGAGTVYASPDQYSGIIWDSDDLPAGLYTSMFSLAGSGYLLLDGFYYRPA